MLRGRVLQPGTQVPWVHEHEEVEAGRGMSQATGHMRSFRPIHSHSWETPGAAGRSGVCRPAGGRGRPSPHPLLWAPPPTSAPRALLSAPSTVSSLSVLPCPLSQFPQHRSTGPGRAASLHAHVAAQQGKACSWVVGWAACGRCPTEATPPAGLRHRGHPADRGPEHRGAWGYLCVRRVRRDPGAGLPVPGL